jgi:hypothetical protein
VHAASLHWLLFIYLKKKLPTWVSCHFWPKQMAGAWTVSTVPPLVSNAPKHTVLTLRPSLAERWPFGQPWVLHYVHKAMLCSSHWDFPLLQKEKGSQVRRC